MRRSLVNWLLPLFLALTPRLAPAQVAGLCGPGKNCTANRFLANDGTVSAPAYSWVRDTDTGFYRLTANTIGFTSAGVRALTFGTNWIRGDTDTTQLTLASATGARLAYSTSSVKVTTSLITLDGAAGYVDVLGNIERTSGGASGAVTFEDSDGISVVGAAQTSFPTHSAAAMQRDTNRNALWWKGGASPGSTTPWVNLGGGQHPTTERKTYMVEMGQESTATPTWSPGPRIGATTIAITVVDAAAAVAQSIGTSPYLTDARGSVTLASAASISSGIADNAIWRLDHGVRWCQRVSTSSKTTARFWLGLSVALPGSSDTNANEHVSFRSSSVAGDANWQACSRDGSTQSCTDTGVSVTTGTSAFQLMCIDCYEGSACVYSIDGLARVRKTTNLPTVTTKLKNYWSVEATAAAARTLYAGTSSVETQ